MKLQVYSGLSDIMYDLKLGGEGSHRSLLSTNWVLYHHDDDLKVYIRPDSLHLLEPRVGDLCRVTRNSATYYLEVHEIHEKDAQKGFWSGGSYGNT
jgi:hypothetical protein